MAKLTKALKSLLQDDGCMARNALYNIMSDNDCLVKEEHLPGKYKGMTLRRNGQYTILLNDGLNRKEKCKVLEHELRHLADGDFTDEKSIEDKENI